MNRVVFASRGGNTKKLAEAVAAAVGTQAVPMDQFDTSLASDVLFVGASIYGGVIDPGMRELLASLKPSLTPCVAVFGTSAGKRTPLPEIRAILEPRGFTVLEDSFHCRGSFLFLNGGRPNGEDLEEAGTFARRIGGRPL